MVYILNSNNEKSKLRKIIAKMEKTNYNKREMPMANEIVKKLGMKSDIVFKAFFSK